jgi:hypothetical protein
MSKYLSLKPDKINVEDLDADDLEKQLVDK